MKKLLFLLLLIFLRNFSSFGQVSTKPLTISHLTGNFYVYTTYRQLDGNPYPSNSMYMVTDSGVVMFDTPWDTTQFQPLLDSIEICHHKKVVLCIATHFHEDRTAGLDFLKSKGVVTYSSKLTYDLCKERNDPQAQFFFLNDTVFNIGGYSFKTYYGGQGHSADNIVIWFDQDRILYGGCLIKSVENKNLGNVSDANIAEWPITLRRIMRAFPQREYVIPGHFGWSDKKGPEHTLRLLSAYKKSK